MNIESTRTESKRHVLFKSPISYDVRPRTRPNTVVMRALREGEGREGSWTGDGQQTVVRGRSVDHLSLVLTYCLPVPFSPLISAPPPSPLQLLGSRHTKDSSFCRRSSRALGDNSW